MTSTEMNLLIASKTGIWDTCICNGGYLAFANNPTNKVQCQMCDGTGKHVPDFATEPWSGKLLKWAWERMVSVEYRPRMNEVHVDPGGGKWPQFSKNPDHRIALRDAFASMMEGENNDIK